MSTPPPKTFHLQTARDRHDMLVWEVEQLIDTSITDPRLVAYRTVHCAVSAWHMTDWVFEGLDDERRREWSVGNDDSLIGFKKWARFQQPFLSICRELAESAKHKVMTRDVSDVISTERVDRRMEDGEKAVFWALNADERVQAPSEIEKLLRKGFEEH